MRNDWMWFGRQQFGTFTLARDATFRPAAGLVRVERGTVVVTQSGDHEDHVLEGGAEFRPARRGRVVIWALDDAQVTVAPAGAPRATSAASEAPCVA